MTTTDQLELMIRKTIKRMRRDGTVGCSRANLKQCLSTLDTRELTCSVPEFHAGFEYACDRVTGSIRGFELYL